MCRFATIRGMCFAVRHPQAYFNPPEKINHKSGNSPHGCRSTIHCPSSPSFMPAIFPLSSVVCLLSTVTCQLFSFLYICRESSTNRSFYAKQTQFAGCSKLYKCRNNKELWKKVTKCPQPKQTQTNPISNGSSRPPIFHPKIPKFSTVFKSFALFFHSFPKFSQVFPCAVQTFQTPTCVFGRAFCLPILPNPYKPNQYVPLFLSYLSPTYSTQIRSIFLLNPIKIAKTKLYTKWVKIF